MRGANAKQYRVLNLIKKADLETASPKKRAVIGLLKWQPLAVRIRFEDRCAIRGCKGITLSYQTPHDDRPRGPDRETCGYWCSRCDFGNAGSRPIQIERRKPGDKPGF